MVRDSNITIEPGLVHEPCDNCESEEMTAQVVAYASSRAENISVHLCQECLGEVVFDRNRDSRLERLMQIAAERDEREGEDEEIDEEEEIARAIEEDGK